MLNKFNIITCVDKKWGIGKNNSIPWTSDHDLKWFKELTENQIVIMGRNTWTSLPIKPLPNRINIIVSKTLSLHNSKNTYITSSLNTALSNKFITKIVRENYLYHNKKIFVIGGENIYKEALQYNECENVFITHLVKSYDCDKFFPSNYLNQNNYQLYDIHHKDKNMEILQYRNQLYNPNELNISANSYGEKVYLQHLQNILEYGQKNEDRTGVGTLSSFGINMEFNLQNNIIPLLTTKRVYWKGIVEELLWFLRGSTNVKELQEKKVNIWDGNSSREFLDSRGLTHLNEGDIGPTYGFNFRHYGATYHTCHSKYENDNSGFDQVADVLHKLRNNPSDRRIIINLWNPMTYNDVALPPCLFLYQFYVTNDKETNKPRWLSCSIYQRSGDMGLGVPFNIASASLLTYILAHLSGLTPLRLYHTIGNAHIYLNHIDALKEQITRTPIPFPLLHINNNKHYNNVEDFTFEDFKIIGYNPMETIQMKMAV